MRTSMPSNTWANLNELFNGIYSVVYPEEGSIAKTSVKILIITASVLQFLNYSNTKYYAAQVFQSLLKNFNLNLTLTCNNTCKLRFPGHPRAKERCQGPPDGATAQPQISSFAHVLQNSVYTNAVALEPQYKCTVTQTWIAQTKSHFPWISPPLFQSFLLS